MSLSTSHLRVLPTPEIGSLLAEHQGAIRGYILSLTADPHLTEDVLQETSLVVWRKETDFEPGSNFLAWACRIAYYEVLRQRKKRQREKLVFDDAMLEQVAAEAEEEANQYVSRRQALKDCLDQLGEHNQQLIRQRYFDNTPLDQIAERRESNPNAISQLLFRLRQQLMRCIQQGPEDH